MIYGQGVFLSGEPVISGIPLDDVFVDSQLVISGAVSEPLRAHALTMNEPVEIDIAQYMVRLAAYLEGDSDSAAGEIVRGVIYTAGGALVAESTPIKIDPDRPAGWVVFNFPDPRASLLAPGSYRIGLHSGVTDGGARYFIAPAITGRDTYYGHSFTDGAPTFLSDGSPAEAPGIFFIEAINPFPIPTNVTDDYLATLPFDITQRVFTASGPIRSSRTTARAGWYGTTFDPTNGANAIVRSDGALADRVGERILVTRHDEVSDRSVAVYVHDERDFPDELADQDLVLTARAFVALGSQPLDGLDVEVATLA